MKKYICYFLWILISFYTYPVFSQNPEEKCATEFLHQRLLKTDSEYKANFEIYQRAMQDILRNKSMQKTSGTIYTIPVVVHVMHVGSSVGTAENISDTQILSAIDALNDDYRKRPGTNGDGNGIDVEMEFCLASKDPSGSPHSGINRIDASGVSDFAANGLTYNGSDNEAQIKALSKWDKNKYYNIWVVYKINGSNQSGVQGFAYFPGASSTYDGAVMLYNAFGTVGNLKSYTNKNRTATHEIGHALGLYHTFEGDNDGTVCPTDADCGTNGDCIADTPPHIRSSSDCQNGTNSCTGGLRSDFIHNYMDYSSDDCQNMYTQGQKTRMQAVLGPGGLRNGLVSSSNLIASGCNQVPTANFSVSSTSPCEGMAVQFTDLSTNAASGWSWNFTGGNPSSSTAQNPTITYSGTGPYDVTLTTSNTFGSSTPVNKNAYISPRASQSLPYVQDFEAGTSSLNDFNITTNTESRLQLLADAARTSLYGIVMDGDAANSYTNPSTPNEAFSINPLRFASASVCINATNAADLTLTYDMKQIFRYQNYYTNFRITANGNQVDSVYQPSGATTAWSTKILDLSAYAGQVVDIAFEANTKYLYNGGGTNIGNGTYVDNINIQGSITTGLDKITRNTLHIYPNPYTKNTQIVYELKENGLVSIEIFNMIGQVIRNVVNETQAPGNYNYTFGIGQQGLYILKVTINGESKLYRLVEMN